MPALRRMYDLRDAGNLERAREQMRKVLAVEVVPFYRRIAQGQLDQLDDWKPPSTKKVPRKGTRATRKPRAKSTKAPQPKKSASRKGTSRKTAHGVSGR